MYDNDEMAYYMVKKNNPLGRPVASPLSMTLPVSTASCERLFWCLKRLKNYLRSTMGHERLTSLALIYIERDLLQLDSLDSVVDKLKNSSNQTRRILL
jgi:hypothetical protein